MPFGVWSMIAKRSSLVMALLLALPQAALALGLGTIHVKSHLDQPLDARIDLLDATPGAVQSLSVGLASQATFAKYGLNWPSYLNGVQVKVVPGPGGSVQLHVTSPLPVTDPILTLLVKASWDRGVLFREYTILVNPPVYVPGSSQPHHVAVAAPVVGNAPRTGELPGAPAVSAPTAAAATLPASSSGGPRTLRVHAGQTLSGIASRFSGGGMDSGPTRQWMVAIYQRNPQAFASNMNLLRAGAVLHIPSASAAAQVSPNAAWQQVLSQDNAWRAAQGQGSSRSGHLRLVAPQAPGAGASAGASAAPGTSAQVSALQSQVQTLQKELQQEKRLVEVKSAALAALQSQAAAGAAAAHTGTATAPAAAPGAPAHTVQAHRPASAAVPRPAAPGALGQMVHRYWWALLALLALIGAYLAAKVLRSRGESAADERLIESAEPGFAAPAARVMPVTPSGAAPHADDAIDVREATHEQPRLEMNEAGSARVAPHVPADQTMSSETALNLEQGDPLAEADFHMAYGLYDQAADLIRIAIQREPERRDLKLKLLEVFFVWGNKDQFVELAHELGETREHAPAGEWEKVVIMGRQLAPDDPLFAGSELSGAASQGVDLDLEGGQGRVDFDLMDGAGHAAGSGGTASTASTGSFDLDIGAALGEETHVADTVANTLAHTLPGGDTEETPQWPGAGAETGVTQELPGQGPDAASAFEPMEPTVEQPALHQAGHAALREKVEALSQGSDRTAELAIDDLGLDLGAFETSVQPALGGDSPTLVAGLDAASREVLERTGEAGEHAPKPAVPSSTGTTSAWQIDERELENLLSEEQGGSHDTSMTSRLNALEAGGVDFDLGGAAEPQAKPQNGNGLDFDIGAATFAHASLVVPHESPTEENSIAEFEPVTLSEVGTKLDLARAYMDMGDPEGARSILEEVMHEGSDAQRQEAGRLLESLPG